MSALTYDRIGRLPNVGQALSRQAAVAFIADTNGHSAVTAATTNADVFNAFGKPTLPDGWRTQA